jgi:midasin
VQTFLTLLSDTTAPYVEALLTVHILKGLKPAELSRTPPAPPSAGASHVLFEQYWVEAGPGPLPEADAKDDFVVTPSMRRHLATLARAVLLRRHPILLQVCGPPSCVLRGNTIPVCEEETYQTL